MSADQFARVCGVDRTTVSRWEGEVLTPPDWLMGAILGGDWPAWAGKPKAWSKGVSLVWEALQKHDEGKTVVHPRYILLAVLLATGATAAEEICARIS